MKRVAMIMSVAFICALPGCTEIVKRPPTSALEDSNGTRIDGYTTKDGVHHACSNCRALPQGRDRMLIKYKEICDPYIISCKPSQPDTEIATADLASVDMVDVQIGRSILLGFGIALGLVVGIAAIAAATKSSCPFIYSFDGKQYVFDGEPYGGAVMESLARTDYSELKHLAAVDGEYRLLLRNQVDETQHTDSLFLWVVDHPASVRPVVDPEGGVHAFRSVSQLIRARDERGKDLLPWLRETDHVIWQADVDELSKTLPLADTRNHLTLEFARPDTHGPVYLLTNAATALWGSKLIKTMLQMRGNSLPEFVAAVNREPLYQQQLRDWNDREELFHLGVQVQVGGGRWERRAFIPGGGPFQSEDRAIELDLSGVVGDTVRIRIDPPVGMWALDSFRLAWDEVEVTKTELKPRLARDEQDRDVLPALLADDGRTLDQPLTSNTTRLIYAAPPAVPDSLRTVFARTHGWYEAHLDSSRPPEVENLQKLAVEHGYIIQRGMRDYVQSRDRALAALRGEPARQEPQPQRDR